MEARRLRRLTGRPEKEADDEGGARSVRPFDDVAGERRREGLGEDEREKKRGGLDRRHAMDVLKVCEDEG